MKRHDPTSKFCECAGCQLIPGDSLKVRPRICPKCAVTLDGAASLNGRVTQEPAVGDLTVCGYCGEVLEFTSDGALRKLGRVRWALLQPDLRANLTRVVEAVRAARFARGA